MRKWFKKHWKNIALVMLCCHILVDITAYGNLIYTIITYLT